MILIVRIYILHYLLCIYKISSQSSTSWVSQWICFMRGEEDGLHNHNYFFRLWVISPSSTGWPTTQDPHLWLNGQPHNILIPDWMARHLLIVPIFNRVANNSGSWLNGQLHNILIFHTFQWITPPTCAGMIATLRLQPHDILILQLIIAPLQAQNRLNKSALHPAYFHVCLMHIPHYRSSNFPMSYLCVGNYFLDLSICWKYPDVYQSQIHVTVAISDRWPGGQVKSL